MTYQIEVRLPYYCQGRLRHEWKAVKPSGPLPPYQYATLAEAEQTLRLVRDVNHPERFRIATL